ncbi:MAG: chromate transporter [Candidatus Gastranaerophilales bacterium]|nr:chromate transporter [Candidatus Gastranaerophilales bacterium]
MNNLILLFFEFFKVGLFTFGGGYASLPFLYNMIDTYHWFTHFELTQFIAIAGLTPGPVGLNMATFAGYNTEGIFGSLVASIALIIPMIIITSFVFKLYKKFSQNEYIKTILYVLRPTSCALLTFVGIKLFKNLIIFPKDYLALILALILFLMTFRFPRNPAVYLFGGALFGIFVWFLKALM